MSDASKYLRALFEKNKQPENETELPDYLNKLQE